MRFTTRTLTRAFTAAALSLVLAACDIGEGNGIVSIQIIESNGTTDFEMRHDQCEGLSLDVLATFTDGQLAVYTHRVDWEIVSGPATVEPIQSFGFTIDAEVIPDGTAPIDGSGTAVVKATYLDLEATATIKFTDESIASISPTIPRMDLFADEGAVFSPRLITTAGNQILPPARVMEYAINESTEVVEITAGTNSVVGIRAIDDITATTNNTVTGTYCSRVNGLTETFTVPVTAYNIDDGNLNIEARTNTQLTGPTADNISLPQGVNTLVRSVLVFPNGQERDVTFSLNSDGDPDSTYSITGASSISFDTDNGNGRIESATDSIGTNTITIDYQPDGMTNPLTDTVDITVKEAFYHGMTPFKITDRQGNVLDLSATPAASIKSNASQDLRLVATLTDSDGSTDPYDFYFDSFDVASPKTEWTTDDSNIVDVEKQSIVFALNPRVIDLSLSDTQVVGASEATDFTSPNNQTNIVIDLTELPGTPPANPSFVAEVHNDDFTALRIEGPTVGNADDLLQLTSFMEFNGPSSKDIYATVRTAWSSDTPSVAHISNLTSQKGQVTLLSAGSAIITGSVTFTDKDGNSTTLSSTHNITVN